MTDLFDVLPQRFAKRTSIDANGCVLFDGALCDTGYACGSVNGRTVRLHRFAYEITIGPIPVGLQLDHLCRERRCINPCHLEPVTPKENVRRSMAPSAVAVRNGSCLAGHPFDAANTMIRPDGDRRCRACHNAGKRRRRKEKNNAK